MVAGEPIQPGHAPIWRAPTSIGSASTKSTSPTSTAIAASVDRRAIVHGRMSSRRGTRARSTASRRGRRGLARCRHRHAHRCAARDAPRRHARGRRPRNAAVVECARGDLPPRRAPATWRSASTCATARPSRACDLVSGRTRPETIVRAGRGGRRLVDDRAGPGARRHERRARPRDDRRVRRAVPDVALLAGGGVRGPEDLQRLADAGCDGALVATALHDGRLGGGRHRRRAPARSRQSSRDRPPPGRSSPRLPSRSP